MKVVMIDALFLAARGEKPYHLKISAEAYTGNLDALHRPGFITVQFNTLCPLMRDGILFSALSNICPRGSLVS